MTSPNTSGTLIVAERVGSSLSEATAELISAALSVSDSRPISVLVLGDGDDAIAAGIAADELVFVTSADRRRGAPVAAAAVASVIADRRPALVLAAHSVEGMGWASAVAAGAELGFASDVIGLRDGPEGRICQRELYGGKVQAEIDFPETDTIVLLLRRGVWSPAPKDDRSPTKISRVAPDLAVRDTTYVATVDAVTDDVDITKAEVILSIGRGVDDKEELGRFTTLAEQLGATLAFSRPLIDAGWASPSRQVGQSGKTVKPRVYIALGISGAIQHLAGMDKAGTIVAVNTDPDAPIFRVAHYRATIDLFDVVDELERLTK